MFEKTNLKKEIVDILYDKFYFDMEILHVYKIFFTSKYHIAMPFYPFQACKVGYFQISYVQKS